MHLNTNAKLTLIITMNIEEFGSNEHFGHSYLFESNDFNIIPHFNDNGEVNIDIKITKFTNFIKNLQLGEISLSSYLEEGGSIMDSYEHYQYGNGYHTSITIPETIVQFGLIKLLREMISIEPECVDLVSNEYSLLSHSIRYGNDDVTDLLLIHGADPNAFGRRGKTSLYHAIMQNDVKIVKKILDNGADPNLKYGLNCSNYLHTALSNCAWIESTDKEIAKIIIKYGGKPQYHLYTEKIKNIYNEIIAEMNKNGEY